MNAHILLAGVLLATASAALAHGHGHTGHPSETARGAPLAWTTSPLIEESSAGMRNRTVIVVRNLPVETVRVYPPTGAGKFPDSFAVHGRETPYDAPLHRSRFALVPEGRGNYYWIMARAESPTTVTIAGTVRYFSNPGPAPTAMLGVAKSELEIVPEPLPREHWQYREGEIWPFNLRFRGHPLTNTPVWFIGEHGARHRFLSDSQGTVRITFPEDIPVAPGTRTRGHHERPKARFVLVAEHHDAGRRYLTAFNYSYTASAMRGRSLMAGVGFMLLGGILATPLLRRQKTPEKEKSHA